MIYLLFDSRSLRAKSAEEIRFQVKTIPEVNQNLHGTSGFPLDKSHKISDVQTVWFQVHKSNYFIRIGGRFSPISRHLLNTGTLGLQTNEGEKPKRNFGSSGQ